MEESCGSKAAIVPNGYDCPVCLDILKEPMLLPCGHTLCLKCLKELSGQTKECKGRVRHNEIESLRSDHLYVANVEEISQCSAATDSEATESKTVMQLGTVDESQDKETGANLKESFSCPCCRRDIEVPESGIMAFALNVDIDHEELEKARNSSRCLVHQNSINNIVCIDCDAIVCATCKMDKHLHHKSNSIEDAGQTARDQLLVEKKRIEAICKNLQTETEERRKKLTNLENKKAVVEREIRQRCSLIVAEAEKLRECALAALQTSFDDQQGNMIKDLDAVDRKLKEARKLCGRIEYAQNSGDSPLLLTVAKEMTSGAGSVAATKKLKEVGQETKLTSLVHRSEVKDMGPMFGMMQKVIGQCEVVRFADQKDEDDFVCVPKFHHEHHDNATVFCIKANRSGRVIMSFDASYHVPSPQAIMYDQDCCTLLTEDEHQVSRGTPSFTERLTVVTCRNNPTNFEVYAKSVYNNSLTWILYRANDVNRIASDEIVCANPYQDIISDLFFIESISCRAFDVDQSQKYFVVVEEGDKPDNQRKVLLYRRPDTDITVTAVDTFISPITPFQPTDVCFYTLKKEQVLVIADEANDALHLAEVKDNRVTFTRFLCPGCPLLLQPTALNTDHEGRLWVGCRGGRILTVQPVAEDNIDLNVQKT